MFDLKAEIPSYITDKKNITTLILFTAAFALLFINVYAPFDVRTWYPALTQNGLFVYSSLTILLGVLVVVLSRVIMFSYSKKHSVTYRQYFVWVAAEVFFMALFYALFEKLIFKGERYFPDLLKISVQNTALVLLLPYSALWLYFSWRDKKDLLATLTQMHHVPDNSQKMIAFLDEKGVLRLSLKMENLLYIESSDNYVYIYYLSKNKVMKFLLRNTLKKLEHLFTDSEVIRCHRSFMINFRKIRLIRKDKEGLKVELDLYQAIDLPVSKTYAEDVMATFMNYSKIG